jgi:4-hydroxy-tetrahydrodipicolinate synthase
MTKELSGVLTALATPFDANDQIDVALLQKLVDRSINAGVDALVAGGGTGEVSSLTDDERLHLFEVVIEHTAERVPVVANTGGLTAKRAIQLSQAAERAGADVLMLLTPYYEPLTMEEITRYIKAVTAAVEIPIMLYNNPGVTGVNLDAETLGAFGREIDNIRYVKDSSTDWEQALRLIHHHRGDIGLIMGWDSYIFSALLEGATGVMAGAANVVPEEIVGVARAIRAGDVDGAREKWRRVFPVIDAMLVVPFTQAVKAGLRLQGEPIGSAREPLIDLSPEGVSRLEAALARLSRREDLEPAIPA